HQMNEIIPTRRVRIEAAETMAHIEYPHPILRNSYARGPIKRLQNNGHLTTAAVLRHSHADSFGLIRDAANPDLVVAMGSDDSPPRRAVSDRNRAPSLWKRIRGFGYEGYARDDRAQEVGVVLIDSSIEHGDRHTLSPTAFCMKFWHTQPHIVPFENGQ